MSENPDSKDRSLEALDFVLNVLKEHEKVLDKSIQKLEPVTEKLGDLDGLNGKVAKLEEKMNNLQKEITNLINYLSNSPKQTTSDTKIESKPQTQISSPTFPCSVQSGPILTLHCKQWMDFQNIAGHAQTVSFSFKDAEKVLQVDAIKENQVITYTGVVPSFSLILKNWLSIQLGTAERNIIEGSLGKV